MIRLTYDRLAAFMPPERILLLTLDEQLPLVRQELPELAEENIFTEPVGRNTAPSLAVAAEMVRARVGMPLCCAAPPIISSVMMRCSRSSSRRREM